LPLFGKEGNSPSLWKREVRRDFRIYVFILMTLLVLSHSTPLYQVSMERAIESYHGIRRIRRLFLFGGEQPVGGVLAATKVKKVIFLFFRVQEKDEEISKEV